MRSRACQHDFSKSNKCDKCGISINALPPNLLALCKLLDMHRRNEQGVCVLCGDRV